MKGILSKPDMIKAIIEGRKTQTRRLSGLKEINKEPDKWEASIANGKQTLTVDGQGFQFIRKPMLEGQSNLKAVKPRYRVGETIYIKEAWHFLNANYESPLSAEHFGGGNDFAIEYSDGELRWWKDNAGEFNYPLDERKCSLMFMPEKYARYFIKITAVRAERLQEITEEDAMREGIDPSVPWGFPDGYINSFGWLWDSINPKFPFESNPFVWVYRFKLIEKGG